MKRKPEAKDFIDASLIEEIKKSGYIEASMADKTGQAGGEIQ